MNEKDKLSEAKYFYSRAIVEEKNREVFKHYLSAFLTSARSVMQYARKEAKRKNGGQRWYDDWMNSSAVLRFFKDKRDINIHTAPIKPKKHVKIHSTDVIHLSEALHIKVMDKNGNVKEEREIREEPKPKERPKSSVKSESRYEFNDWTGSEDLMILCKMYIEELEKVVQDGISKGIIAC